MLTTSLKKTKLKYLFISGLASPLVLMSCLDPYTEIRKGMTESLLPRGAKSSVNPGGKEQDKSVSSSAIGTQLESVYSDTINDSVLGLNGQKKNPKSPQNMYSVDKNYVSKIEDASFIPSPTNKYGLTNYWYYYQSLPYMLEKSGIKKGASNYQEEYLKKVNYLEEKIKKYLWENLAPYNSNRNFDAWEGVMQDFNKKTGLKDQNKGFDQVVYGVPSTDKYWPLVAKALPENERENKTPTQKKMLVHDFMFGNGFAKVGHMDVIKDNNERMLPEQNNKIENYVRYFRDDYYKEIGYKPSHTELQWYAMLELVQRVQRNYKGQYAAAELIQSLTEFEKQLFKFNDKTKSLVEQIENNLKNTFEDIERKFNSFFIAAAHTSLRKDLVFNIDIGQNVDMQSLAADLIKVYNQKIAPIIWKYNTEIQDESKKITPPIKSLDSVFLKDYVYPLMGNLQFEELDEKKTEDGKPNPISQQKWETWKDSYKELYGWQYQESILSHSAAQSGNSNLTDSPSHSTYSITNSSESATSSNSSSETQIAVGSGSSSSS